jgi:hypothetical protein
MFNMPFVKEELEKIQVPLSLVSSFKGFILQASYMKHISFLPILISAASSGGQGTLKSSGVTLLPLTVKETSYF